MNNEIRSAFGLGMTVGSGRGMTLGIGLGLTLSFRAKRENLK